MENEEYRKQIDELFRLFKKLMERYPAEDIPGMSKQQMEQLKLFLENYDEMRDSISFEILGEMNAPMKQMMEMFIKQLREQLGEDADIDLDSEESISEKSNFDKEMTIEDIDKMLRNPNLSAEEIDQLLDQRTRLVGQKPDAITE